MKRRDFLKTTAGIAGAVAAAPVLARLPDRGTPLLDVRAGNQSLTMNQDGVITFSEVGDSICLVFDGIACRWNAITL